MNKRFLVITSLGVLVAFVWVFFLDNKKITPENRIIKMQNDSSISYQEFNAKLYDFWGPQPSAGRTDSIKPDEWEKIFKYFPDSIPPMIRAKKMGMVKFRQFDDVFYHAVMIDSMGEGIHVFTLWSKGKSDPFPEKEDLLKEHDLRSKDSYSQALEDLKYPVTGDNLEFLLKVCPDSIKQGIINKFLRLIREDRDGEIFFSVISMNHKGKIKNEDVFFHYKGIRE
jgi:hypothetical protein